MKEKCGFYINGRKVSKEDWCAGWATPTSTGFTVTEIGDPVEPALFKNPHTYGPDKLS